MEDGDSSRSELIETVEKKITNKNVKPTDKSKHISEINKDMVRMLKAPATEIDVFSENPNMNVLSHYSRNRWRKLLMFN